MLARQSLRPPHPSTTVLSSQSSKPRYQAQQRQFRQTSACPKDRSRQHKTGWYQTSSGPTRLRWDPLKEPAPKVISARRNKPDNNHTPHTSAINSEDLREHQTRMAKQLGMSSWFGQFSGTGPRFVRDTMLFWEANRLAVALVWIKVRSWAGKTGAGLVDLGKSRADAERWDRRVEALTVFFEEVGKGGKKS